MALELVWELEEKMCATGGNCVLVINELKRGHKLKKHKIWPKIVFF
jgi:hypothetical protein